MRQILLERRRSRSRRVTRRFAKFLIVTAIIVIGVIAGVKLIPITVSKAIADANMHTTQGGGDTLNQAQVIATGGPDTIVVDAGHGGDDFGTMGVLTGRKEKEVNLEIAQKLQKALETKGFRVIMTRQDDGMIAPTKDEDMKKREKIIRESGEAMFISIHQNFYDKGQSVSGPQVFSHDQGTPSYELAKNIQRQLNQQLEITSPREAGWADYQLLRTENVPSVIVECGFFSNPKEEQKLQQDDYQNDIVSAIISGVDAFLAKQS